MDLYARVTLVVVLLLPSIVLANNEILCLAKNIYFEARGEPEAGQFAVGFVTLNRVNASSWPNTFCSTVYQSNQFVWTNDEHSNTPLRGNAFNRAIYIASIVMQSHETEDYGYYFNTTHKKGMKIGKHVFYK